MSSVSVLCVLAVAVLSVASARPGHLTYAVPAAAPAPITYLPGHVSSQYHAQDDFGQYSYGYNDLSSSKSEHRTLDGVTRGAYSYVDAEGKLQRVQYTADPIHGFRVAASNLPEDSALGPAPVEDTPEVAQAKAEHFAAVEQAKTRQTVASIDLSPLAPEPVQDTPEVAQAKSEHFAAVEEAKIRNVVEAAKYVAPYHPLAYSTYNYNPLAYTAYSAYAPLTKVRNVVEVAKYVAPYHPLTYSTYNYTPLAYSPLAAFPYTPQYFAQAVRKPTVEYSGKVGYPYA